MKWLLAAGPDRLATTALVLVLGAVYGRTMLPATGLFGDTSLFQFQGPLLGLNLTGYPQHTLLAFLFGWLVPLGSVAWRVTLLSAVCAVAACGVLYALLRRLGAGPWLALCAALSFGLSLTFWSQAVIAEVYALNALWVAVVLLAAIRWGETPEDEGKLFDAGLAWALSLGNHLTMAFLAPALIGLFLMRAPATLGRSWRTWVGLAACGLIGLSQYAYVYWRTFDLDASYTSTLVYDFVGFFPALTGGGTELQGLMFARPWQHMVLGEGWGYVKHLLREFYLLPVGLVAFGAVTGPGWLRGFLALAFGGELLFCLNYAIPDIRYYYIPTFLVASVWLGLGAARLVAWWPSLHRWRWMLAALPATMLVLNFSANDRSTSLALDARVRHTLDVVGENALIVTPEYTETMAFSYYLFAEGRRERNLWRYDSGAGDRQDVRPVVAYMRRGAPLTIPQQRCVVPPGLTVFCTSAAHVEAFAAQGVTCRPVAPDVWRVGRAILPAEARRQARLRVTFQ